MSQAKIELTDGRSEIIANMLAVQRRGTHTL